MHRASLLLFTTLLILLFLTAELPAAKSSKKETPPKLTMGEAINKPAASACSPSASPRPMPWWGRRTS